jgi:molybdenum cofactor cytidylyltransferase
MFEDIAVIILASGLSKRMGKDKMLIKIKNKPIIVHTIQRYRELFREVIIVSSPKEKIIRIGAKNAKKVVVNSKPEEGMSRSIKLGLLCLSSKYSAFFLALGDQPFIGPDTLHLIVNAYYKKRPKVVIPVYMGVRGNPVLFDISMVKSLYSSLKGDKGASHLIQKYLSETVFLELNDPGISLDIDTPSDLKKAESLTERRT